MFRDFDSWGAFLESEFVGAAAERFFFSGWPIFPHMFLSTANEVSEFHIWLDRAIDLWTKRLAGLFATRFSVSVKKLDYMWVFMEPVCVFPIIVGVGISQSTSGVMH